MFNLEAWEELYMSITEYGTTLNTEVYIRNQMANVDNKNTSPFNDGPFHKHKITFQ